MEINSLEDAFVNLGAENINIDRLNHPSCLSNSCYFSHNLIIYLF